MRSLNILENLTFSHDNRIHEEESTFKKWLENEYDDWLDAVNNPYPLTIDDILREPEPRRKRTDVSLRVLRWRFYKCNDCGRQIRLAEAFVKKPNPKKDPNYLLVCKKCYKERKRFRKRGLLSAWKWKTPKEKRLERRDEGGLKEFNKILNELRKSEELSTNLKKRLLRPSKQFLLDVTKQEIESLCKADEYYCHFAVTYTQKMLTEEFRDRFRRLHEMGWIHSRKMEDAAFVVLHVLLVEKLNEKIEQVSELPIDEILSNEISDKMAETFLRPVFVSAVIDAIEKKFPERTKLLYERDLQYFLGREFQRIKEELLKKHPELQIESVPYFPRHIDSALFNIRRGDLWQLFRMPYYEGKKPVELLKRVETQVRIRAEIRFKNFLSSLNNEQLKRCKKTGLNAACCYIETYLREFYAYRTVLTLYGDFFGNEYKSEILVLPVSQEEWAKAFGITRQTLINRIKELEEHDPSIIERIIFVKDKLA